MSKENLSVRVEKISPHLAREYLEKNAKNRPIGKGRVKRFAEDMAAGEFSANGEAIIFNGDGSLVDGQHRLLACVESGATFRSVVVRGAPSDAFATVDTGSLRTGADMVGIAGYEHHRATAQALRHIWEHTVNGDRRRIRGRTLSNKETAKLITEFPEIAESVEFVQAIGTKKLLNLGSAAYLHWLFIKADDGIRGEADRFIKKLVTGENMDRNHPIYRLRERLIEANSVKHRKLRDVERVATAINAWNRWRMDMDCPTARSIAWASRGKRRSPFPQAV